MFRTAGYDPIAPGWPNESDTVEQSRRQPELVADTTIDDATAHYATIIDAVDTSPIIIGHSVGGLIAEKLLGQSAGRAAVAIDPAQIKGVLPLPLAQIRAALPALGNPGNLHRSISLTRKQFQYGFGNALPTQESDTLYDQWTIPAPARPLFQAALAKLRAPRPGQSRNRQLDPRSTAADLGHRGPHRPRRRHPGHPQAVPPLHRGHRPQAD